MSDLVVQRGIRKALPTGTHSLSSKKGWDGYVYGIQLNDREQAGFGPLVAHILAIYKCRATVINFER